MYMCTKTFQNRGRFDKDAAKMKMVQNVLPYSEIGRNVIQGI